MLLFSCCLLVLGSVQLGGGAIPEVSTETLVGTVSPGVAETLGTAVSQASVVGEAVAEATVAEATVPVATDAPKAAVDAGAYCV